MRHACEPMPSTLRHDRGVDDDGLLTLVAREVDHQDANRVGFGVWVSKLCFGAGGSEVGGNLGHLPLKMTVVIQSIF